MKPALQTGITKTYFKFIYGSYTTLHNKPPISFRKTNYKLYYFYQWNKIWTNFCCNIFLQNFLALSNYQNYDKKSYTCLFWHLLKLKKNLNLSSIIIWVCSVINCIVKQLRTTRLYLFYISFNGTLNSWFCRRIITSNVPVPTPFPHYFGPMYASTDILRLIYVYFVSLCQNSSVKVGFASTTVMAFIFCFWT